MNSQPATQTTTTESEPWEASQPYLKDVMGQAQTLYNSDQGREYFPFSTTVPFSNQTNDALSMQENLAREGNQLIQPAQSRVQEMMQAGPSAGTDRVASIAAGGMSHKSGQGIYDAANGNQPLSIRQAGNVYDNAASGGMNSTADFGAFTQPGATPSAEMLGGMAQGGNNPHLDQMFDRASGKVKDQINSVFSSNGRYGSVAHQDMLADEMGGMANEFYGSQYNQDQQRRLQAAGQIQGAHDNQQGRALSATGQQAGQQAQDSSRQMQGASALQGLQSQGFGQMAQADQMIAANANQNASTSMQGAQLSSDLNGARDQQALASLSAIPGLRQMQFDDPSRLAQVGTAREQQAGDQLGDAMRRWEYGQQQPYNQLAQYSGLVNGMGQLGGTGSQTMPMQRTNPLMGAAGGAMSGASMGSMFGPMGTAIGGGVGLLGGLFG